MMKKGTCKYFNGIQHDACEAGVGYDQFRVKGTPVFKTFPCFSGCLVCKQFVEPTDEEIAEYEASTYADIEIVLAIDKAVSKGDRVGTIPHSCGGTIKWAWQGPLSMQAKCDGCDWSAIS